MFSSDVNFQNHFLHVAEKQIKLLRLISQYGAGFVQRNNTDNSTVIDFMCNNFVIVKLYWMNKKYIGRSSLWFREKPKYQRWHLSSETESSIALSTGTSLMPKKEPNYWWFEEDILSINKYSFNHLLEREDYISIYSYLDALRQISYTAIDCKEVNSYISHIDWIKQILEKRIRSNNIDADKRSAFAGVIEVMTVLYLDLILDANRVYQNFDLEGIVLQVIEAIDSGENVEKNKYIRGRQSIDLYKKINLEIQVEGKRITPTWVIKQQIAKEEYVYLNSLLDIIREGMNSVFSLGKILSENKLYFEACIIFIRFYEFESKVTKLFNIVETRKKEMTTCQIDKAVKWDESRLEKLTNTLHEWKKNVPELLFNSSSHFALDNWKNREDYPDFLGECYNHICEDAVEAITNGDIKQFEIDFENLSKMMLLYQEYIRSDLVSNMDLYRIEYAYYVFTSPVIEWAQIGGLGILWGEFNSDTTWKTCVKRNVVSILQKDGKFADLAEKLIEYVQCRNKFMLGFSSRDILKTGWQQRVANSIKNSEICEAEFNGFERRLKTQSSLLKAFCPDFLDMGFSKDPAEIIWVLYVNPYLDDEKKFHTRYSWEKKLNE